MLICSTVDEHRMHASLNLEFDAKGAEKRGRRRGDGNAGNRVSAIARIFTYVFQISVGH